MRTHGDVIRCLVTMNDAAQLLWAICVGSGMVSPELLTSRPVIARPGMVVPAPWKR